MTVGLETVRRAYLSGQQNAAYRLACVKLIFSALPPSGDCFNKFWSVLSIAINNLIKNSTIQDLQLSTAHAEKQVHLVTITDSLVACGQFSIN